MSKLGIKNFTKEQDKNIIRQYKIGKSANQIAREVDVLPQRITNCLRRNSIKPKIFYPGAIGEKNGRWKGGVRIIKGYKHILLPNHRLARKDGYVALHRLLLESKIVDKNQVVHHIDGNKQNNLLENLFIYPNNGVHRREHTKSQTRNRLGMFYN